MGRLAGTLVVRMLGYHGWWYGDLAEAQRQWGEVVEIGREAGDLHIEAEAAAERQRTSHSRNRQPRPATARGPVRPGRPNTVAR